MKIGWEDLRRRCRSRGAATADTARGVVGRVPRAVLLLAALGGAGCHLVEADLYNLDELHHADDRHKLEATLQSDFWYGVRAALRQVSARARIGGDGAPERVENAPGECLELLIDLGSFAPDDALVRARQVEWFARLAVGDPWTLSRERAVIGLGEVGRQLGGVEPLAAEPEGDGGGAVLLAETLTSLTEAVRAIKDGRGSRVVQRLDLASACQLLAGEELDIDGLRRALFVTAQLGGKAGLASEDAQPLLALAAELERELIGRALGRALTDEAPRVRAAALEASLAAGSDAPLAQVLARLSREDRLVAKCALDLVRVHGLPPAPEGTTDLLVPIYAQLSRPDQGEVKVSAMRALAAVTDAGFTSLREEDWQSWWRARGTRGSGTR